MANFLCGNIIIFLIFRFCNGILLETNEECPVLEQRLIDTQDKVKLLEEEIKLLKSISSCHCRDGWIHGNGSCYYMPNQQKTWNDARAFCQQLGAHLAVIGTPEEDKIVSDFLTRAHNMSNAYEGVTYVWLGGYDFAQEGHWHWVTGEPFVYTNWRGGGPDNGAGGGEDCMDWSNGWNDNVCSHSYYFLCEM
ncbi:C-type lectin domain family 4 member M-like [Ruditapes philippinarum]|uniref:C-type lectin domain family 4 member M-like n=1 Tax=Ruditapes philippinarum TaxID=129788 RepID=UPI00295BD8F0|nr:C-type lectin domain family 4 member M-like [Ruditapes philippinarum]